MVLGFYLQLYIKKPKTRIKHLIRVEIKNYNKSECQKDFSLKSIWIDKPR